MKKITLITIFLLSLTLTQAQTSTTFQLGWYIIQPDASYSVLVPSYQDVKTENNKLKDVDVNVLEMATGEVVLAFESNNGKIYCFDAVGRIIVFQGESSLKKAPVNEYSSVGYILQDIEILNGTDITAGSTVWIIGQDVSKNTIKIMVQSEKTYEIPREKIELLGKTMREMSKINTFRKAHQ